MNSVARKPLLHRLQARTISLVRRLGARAYLVLAAIFARHATLISWQTTEQWQAAAASTILAALTATLTPRMDE